MKKPYRGLDIQCFKLRIMRENTIVDEKNHRVIHTIDWTIIGPELFFDFMWSICPSNACIHGKTKGIAVCNPDDKFDAEFGIKIARAKAESNAYTNASKRLNKRMNYLRKIVHDLDFMAADFDFKKAEVNVHNNEYIGGLCDY